MPEEFIVRHCSPTLAGIKTGSLFSFSYQREVEMKSFVRELNRMLRAKGIRVLPLRYDGTRALIYLYRPSKLKQDLSNQHAAQLLSEQGYPSKAPEGCVTYLMGKLRTCPEFPHEIGLFLGYPPEDVSGFIQNKGSCCKCVGYWKVYGDEQAAQKCFSKYRQCTDIYCTQWSNGKSLAQLAVTV